jgi:mannose-6-phosphate isomerase-like protein (cupin superfamily)
MRKINSNSLAEDAWSSPKGRFRGAGKELSIALGRDGSSANPKDRHPFDVEILRIPPGQTPYPYHSHAAQWEFYHVISGRGLVRDHSGTTAIEAGDAFIFPRTSRTNLRTTAQRISSSMSSPITRSGNRASIRIARSGSSVLLGASSFAEKLAITTTAKNNYPSR